MNYHTRVMATPILAYRKYTERLVPQSLFFKVFALSMKGSIKKLQSPLKIFPMDTGGLSVYPKVPSVANLTKWEQLL